MNIEEIRIEKHILEKEIRGFVSEKVDKFEEKCEVNVDNISVYIMTERSMGKVDKNFISEVNIEVKI